MLTSLSIRDVVLIEALDLDFGDGTQIDHDAERLAADAGPEAGKGHVAGQVPFRGGAHRVQRALDVPALKLLG